MKHNPLSLIFLDIDGVLVTAKTKDPSRPDPEKVKIFNEIVRRTGAQVVLSSTWRYDKNWFQVMFDAGLRVDFIGVTEQFDALHRGVEIHTFLLEHNLFHDRLYPKSPKSSMHKYVIIDDDSDFMSFQLPHLFKTTWETGLTEEMAERIVGYLNSGMKADEVLELKAHEYLM